MELTESQKKIIQEIHDFVKKECEKFPDDDLFANHIVGVRNFAMGLAEEYNANAFVVEAAAYLHDIYQAQTLNHKIHEIEGSKFAREYLKQFDIPLQEIELAAKCILNHRGSKDRKRESIEEKIVASADAMDHISGCMGMFYRISKGKSRDESIKWMGDYIERGWKKIELEKGREIVRDKYEAAKLLFKI